jgi:hypothetical protein
VDAAVGPRQLGVREIAGQRCVVIANGRGEQDGPDAIQRPIQPRQMARVEMIKTVGRTRPYVAARIQKRERVAVLQRPCITARRGLDQGDFMQRGGLTLRHVAIGEGDSCSRGHSVNSRASAIPFSMGACNRGPAFGTYRVHLRLHLGECEVVPQPARARHSHNRDQLQSVEDVGYDGLFGILPATHDVAYLIDFFLAEVMGTFRVDPA